MKKCVIILTLFLFALQVRAQLQLPLGSKTGFGQRIYFGGNMGAQFGNITYVDVSPLVGYMVTAKFSVGIGVTYRYLKYKQIDYQTSIYGGRLFARHNISLMKLPLFLYGEYENLNYEYVTFTNPPDYTTRREWVPSLFVGGGLFQPIGRRAGFTMMALYNLIYDEQRSPYNSPWVFRVGFTL
jgi:hypothetical protein